MLGCLARCDPLLVCCATLSFLCALCFSIRCKTPCLCSHYGLCRYRISGLSRQPIGAIEFEIEGRGMVRLVDYFRETYNYQIRFPNLPAVQCGKSALPIECCIIVEGQRYGPKLNEQHVS